MRETRGGDLHMDADAFPAWAERQGRRYELLDGRVVEASAERAVHTRTKYAVTGCLERAIAAARVPCEALVDGMAVRIDDATVFEPDALVRSGPILPDDTIVVVDPVIVVEVASPSTARIDALLKLTRYFANPSIAHYLIVLPDERRLVHHRRDGDRIETTIHAAGDLVLAPPGLTLEVGAMFPRRQDAKD